MPAFASFVSSRALSNMTGLGIATSATIACATISCSTTAPRFPTVPAAEEHPAAISSAAAEEDEHADSPLPAKRPPISRAQATELIAAFFRLLFETPTRIGATVTPDARLRWDGRVRPLASSAEELQAIHWGGEARLVPFDPGSLYVLPSPTSDTVALVTVQVESGERRGPWKFLLAATDRGLKIREIAHRR